MKPLKLGDRGPEVSALQSSLDRLGFDCVVDGHFGRKTLAAVQAHAAARTEGGSPAWHVMAINDEAARARTLSSIHTVGAWAGPAAMAKPAAAVKFAADHGINRLDVVINDHSKWRKEKAFDTYTRSKIAKLCERAAAKGIEVHLMSWVMPYESYIAGAAETLIPLCKDVGAASLMWDAEEPWNQATGGMSFKAAAKFLGRAFSNLGIPMGVTGIGFAPTAKLGPLAAECAYAVPQVYVTSGSGLKPETAPRKFHKRWSDAFDREIVMGLAAYKQKGIAGHPTIASAMQAALESTRGLGVSTVIYWSLRHIQGNPEVAKAIAGIRG